MADYRVEIEAIQIIHVEANSAEEAKEKVKLSGLDWQTTHPEDFSNGCTANYHYEQCDFDKAKVTNEDE